MDSKSPSQQTPLGADETSSAKRTPQCVRSFTYAPPGDDAWSKVAQVENHFAQFKYVIGKEKGAKGHPHLEIAVLDHFDEKRNGTRDFARALSCSTKKPELVVRRHNEDKGLCKIGYAMKEGNYFTNIEDTEFLEECLELYNKSKQSESMTSVCNKIADESKVYTGFPRSVEQNYDQYLKYVEVYRKKEIGERFARGEITFEQAIKMGCTPAILQYERYNWTNSRGSKTSSTSSISSEKD